MNSAKFSKVVYFAKFWVTVRFVISGSACTVLGGVEFFGKLIDFTKFRKLGNFWKFWKVDRFGKKVG